MQMLYCAKSTIPLPAVWRSLTYGRPSCKKSPCCHKSTTATKTNVTAMPYETLKSICAAVSIPKVAIGGISQENLMALSGSGVDGVAVVSAIFGAPDPGAAAARLRALAETMVKTRMSLRGAQRRGNP